MNDWLEGIEMNKLMCVKCMVLIWCKTALKTPAQLQP